MEKIDLNKLEVAIEYLNRMAEGKNPSNNKKVDDEVLKDQNVVRCMRFVSEVLVKVKNNNGYIGRRVREKRMSEARKEAFPLEAIKNYVYEPELKITEFVSKLNELRNPEKHKKIKYMWIIDWLKHYDILESEMDNKTGKKKSIPTSVGMKIGISFERRVGAHGEYYTCMYNENAQRFIIENLDEILNLSSWKNVDKEKGKLY